VLQVLDNQFHRQRPAAVFRSASFA
jgi:hypothetical protein